MVKKSVVAQYSGGRNSTAMVLKLLEDENYQLNEVIFTDTGLNYDSIYKSAKRIKKMCKERGVKFSEYSCQINIDHCFASKSNSKVRLSCPCVELLCHMIKNDYEYVCLATPYFGTKTKTISNVIHPLVDYEMTEDDCLQYCYKKNFFFHEDGNVPLYSIIDSDTCCCTCCGIPLEELKKIYLNFPKYWGKIKEFEKQLNRKFKGVGTDELERKFKE